MSENLYIKNESIQFEGDRKSKYDAIKLLDNVKRIGQFGSLWQSKWRDRRNYKIYEHFN